MSGKAKDKAWLQEQMSLTVDPEVPVIGIVSRLVSHKGLDWRSRFVMNGSADRCRYRPGHCGSS